jgi:hypothetical protein
MPEIARPPAAERPNEAKSAYRSEAIPNPDDVDPKT